MTLKTKIEFSIIIPVYNSSSYITETLESIRKGTKHKNYEVILIDDCSSDIEELKSSIKIFSEVKLIQKKIKSNAAESRNIGYLVSKADFVFFLDSDDHYIENAIDRRIELHKEKKCGLIYGNYISSSLNKQKPSNLPIFNKEDIRDYLFIRGGDCRTSTISIYKQKYNSTQFDILSNKHQDWIFLIRCFDNNELIHFDPIATVLINIERPGRMSAAMNIDASNYFCKNYLIKRKHLNNFSKGHWLTILQNKDMKACSFFFSIYKPELFQEKINYQFYKLSSKYPIINISSWFIKLVRKIKWNYH